MQENELVKRIKKDPTAKKKIETKNYNKITAKLAFRPEIGQNVMERHMPETKLPIKMCTRHESFSKNLEESDKKRKPKTSSDRWKKNGGRT